jgi:hypothetical protein
MHQLFNVQGEPIYDVAGEPVVDSPENRNSIAYGNPIVPANAQMLHNIDVFVKGAVPITNIPADIMSNAPVGVKVVRVGADLANQAVNLIGGPEWTIAKGLIGGGIGLGMSKAAENPNANAATKLITSGMKRAQDIDTQFPYVIPSASILLSALPIATNMRSIGSNVRAAGNTVKNAALEVADIPASIKQAVQNIMEGPLTDEQKMTGLYNYWSKIPRDVPELSNTEAMNAWFKEQIANLPKDDLTAPPTLGEQIGTTGDKVAQMAQDFTKNPVSSIAGAGTSAYTALEPLAVNATKQASNPNTDTLNDYINQRNLADFKNQ